MGNKKRRKKLARGINHVLGTAEKCHTLLFYEVEWLQDELKAAIRVVREIDRVLDFYEEDFRADIALAVREAINDHDQSAGSQGTQEEEEAFQDSGASGMPAEEGCRVEDDCREAQEAELCAAQGSACAAV